MFVIVTCTVCSIILHSSVVAASCDEKVDLVFLVDDSLSMGTKALPRIKHFISNVIINSTIGPNNTMVSVLAFSKSPNYFIQLNQHPTKEELLSSINNIPTKLSLGTDLSEAMAYSRNTILTTKGGSRLGARKVLVIVSDGRVEHQGRVSQETLLLNASNVDIVTLGAGSQCCLTKALKNVASDPSYVLYLSQRDSLTRILDIINLTTYSCEKNNTETLPTSETITSTETTSINTIESLSCHDQIDLVFLMDDTKSIGVHYFAKIKDFVSNIINQTIIGPKSTMVGVVPVSLKLNSIIRINANTDKQSLLNAINNIKTETNTEADIAHALKYVKDHVFNANVGFRPEARKILVAVTDGHAPHLASVHTESLLLNFMNVTIVAIGTGQHGISKSGLNTIATFPSFVRYLSHSDSTSRVLDIIQPMSSNCKSGKYKVYKRK